MRELASPRAESRCQVTKLYVPRLGTLQPPEGVVPLQIIVSNGRRGMPEVGELLAEKYRLVKLLSQGGMGAVYVAEHEHIGKRVAVKFLLPHLAEDPEAVARFSREARAAARIGHRSIIDIYDIGTAPDDSLFLVMEFLKGESLGERLEREPILDVSMSAYVVCQILSALDAAHREGIVHRDLKPDNIFLVDTGQRLPDIKLLDFGISKMVDPGAPEQRLTKTGAIMGTPYYLAPEQALGLKELDQVVDIYSMGVILYECLTGKLPFNADNVLSLIHKIPNDPFLPPREHNPELPSALEQVVLRAMARQPDGRYQTARGMLAVLFPFMDERAADRVSLPDKLARPDPEDADDIAVQASLNQAADSIPTQPSTDMAWQSGLQTSERSARRPLLLMTAAGALIAAVGTVAVLLSFSLGDEEQQTGAEPPVGEPAAMTTPAAASIPQSEPGPDAPVPSAEVEEEPITVTLENVPDGASVFLDHNPVRGSSLSFPRSSEDQHEIRVELADHQTWQRTVSADKSLSIPVVLEPVETAERERDERGRDRHERRRSESRRDDRAEPARPTPPQPAPTPRERPRSDPGFDESYPTQKADNRGRKPSTH